MRCGIEAGAKEERARCGGAGAGSVGWRRRSGEEDYGRWWQWRWLCVNWCDSDGQADGTVPRRGDTVDLTAVEAVEEVPVWTRQ
jgi:hypothetical protein